MNINESLRDWIRYNIIEGEPLESVAIVTMGEAEDLEPPFLAIYESGSDRTNELVPGVSTFNISCELHTLPVDETNGGTPPETEREWRRLLYGILGDTYAVEWMSGRNLWRIFDIRLASPITESAGGKRISRWSISVVAHPL